MPSLATLKLIGWAVIAFSFIACLAALRMEQSQNAKLKAQLHECSTLRQADRDSYARAQAEAEAKNLADVALVKQQQQRISDDTVALLNARLERLRRELSKGGASAPQSHPGKPGLPEGGPAPGGADGAAGLCLTPAELLRAAENEERHDRLIDWAERQSK